APQLHWKPCLEHLMNSSARWGRISLTWALLAGCLMVASMAVSEPARANDLPDHARASGHLNGWDCLRGFRRDLDTCVAVKVPANAYLTPSGTDWECNRGYMKNSHGCIAVRVPANAH